MAAVTRFRSVVLDCPDPRELARFYAGIVGGSPEDEDPDWVVLQVPGGPLLSFQRAPGHTPPEWPRADRNSQQFHLDLDAGATWEEVDAAHERVLALGARQQSSCPSVAFDGPRFAWRSRATSSAAPSTRTAFCQVSLARSVLDQPRSSSSASRFG